MALAEPPPFFGEKSDSLLRLGDRRLLQRDRASLLRRRPSASRPSKASRPLPPGEAQPAAAAVVTPTFTVIRSEAAVLPDESRALAVRLCRPGVALVASQVTAPGEEVALPAGAPSTKKSIPDSVVPSASVATAAKDTLPEMVAPSLGEVIATARPPAPTPPPGASVTVSWPGAERVVLPTAPVTVKLACPSAAVPLAASVSVEVAPAVTVAALKLPVTPAGSPVNESESAGAVASAVVVTTNETWAPRATLCAAESAIAKSVGLVELLTRTAIGAEVPITPDESVAEAVSVWLPVAARLVSQATENGVLVPLPITAAPS